jgi:hypothetical protein
MSTPPLSDFEKKKRFLLEHEDFFLAGISIWFRLTHRQLTKYQTILDWWSVVENRHIEWNSEIMDEFKGRIFIEEDIFPTINTNQSLPWSIAFITRFEDLWDWELLSQNEAFMRIPVLRRHFSDRLYPHIGEYEEYDSESYNSKEKTVIEDLERDLADLERYKEWQFQSVEEIEKAKNIDWRRLSQNAVLPWSAELIERYKDKWEWMWLGQNQYIPWSVELMTQFEDCIDWSMDFEDEEGVTTSASGSISMNLGMVWDAEILSAFMPKLNKWPISMSQCTKWDIDLLIQFKDFWDYGSLALNKLIWSNVFSEFNTEAHLDSLLDTVLKKRSYIGK